MKKLFISCPMKDRTEEAIRASREKLHKIAEAVFGEELEVLPSWISDTPPENRNESLWYLGKSIQILSEADCFIGVDIYGYCGCVIEIDAAQEYGIRSFVMRGYQLAGLECFRDVLERPVSPENYAMI